MGSTPTGGEHRWVDLLRFAIRTGQEVLPDCAWQAGISSFEGEKAVVVSGDGWKLVTRKPGVWIAEEPSDRIILAKFGIDDPADQEADETFEPR